MSNSAIEADTARTNATTVSGGTVLACDDVGNQCSGNIDSSVINCFPFAAGHTYLLRIAGYNGDHPTLFNRYFLGGPRTLRGFRYAHVSPTDSLNEPFGGNTYWLGSVEYNIPIIERLRFALFYDIGNVYSSSFSVNPNASRGERLFQDNVGAGFRINIPNLGPLRLDYGIPLNEIGKASCRERV